MIEVFYLWLMLDVILEDLSSSFVIAEIILLI
jgi:hypothetical protein